jgi:hypothetical protein
MRKILLTSLALAVAATPALAHRVADGPVDQKPGPAHDHPQKAEGTKAKGPKGTLHLLHACVVADASATSVDLSVLNGNRHMKRVLDGAETFTAKLDADTRIRLVGKARHLPEGSTPKRLPKIGTHADLTAGDRVIVRLRAKRGLEPGELPAAFSVIDRGPVQKCAPAPATPQPGDGEQDPSL